MSSDCGAHSPDGVACEGGNGDISMMSTDTNLKVAQEG
jgi:hypothetical protein